MTSWETAAVLKAPMEICWQFNYAIESQKLKNLYSKSKRAQWDAERDLDWDYPVDPSRPLIDEDRFRFSQIPFFQALSQTQQESFRAHLTAFQLSQFLHGEQGALMTAAALTHAVPDYEGKLYAATQTMDEARHVEVFNKYLERLAIVYPMSPFLKGLIDAALQADKWVKIAIGMNVVIEGLAIAAYAIGASDGFFYIRTEYPLAVQRIRSAIRQAEARGYLGRRVLGSAKRSTGSP